MSYVAAQPALTTLSQIRQTYAILVGMFLVAGGVGFAVLKVAVKPATDLECLLLFAGIVVMGAITYGAREKEGLNSLCAVLLMGLLGWLGGVAALEHEVIVVTCYLCVLTSFGALCLWSLLSAERLNFWYGVLWCVLVSALVLWCVRSAYPDSKAHLLPIAGAVSVITQLYLLGSSWKFMQKPTSEGAFAGASDFLFGLEDDFAVVECIDVLLQILSFFWWM